MDLKLIELVRRHPELYDMRSNKYNDNAHKARVWKEIGAMLNKTGAAVKFRWLSLRSQHRKVMRKKRRNPYAEWAQRKWRYEVAMEFVLNCMTRHYTHIDVQLEESGDSGKNEDACMDESSESENISELDPAFDFKDEIISPDITIKRQLINVPELDSPIEFKNEIVLSETTVKQKRNNTSELDFAFKFKDKSLSSGPIKQKSTEVAANSTLGKRDAFKETQGDANLIDVFLRSMAATIKTFSRYDQHVVKNQIFSIVSNMEAKYLAPSFASSNE